MSNNASSLPPTFLGIELATDQLRAVILDEHQELVSTCTIDFDADLPEYGTQGGIFVAPGEAWTTPVEMWVRGLDMLLSRLSTSHPLHTIRSISGCALPSLVWWKSTPLPALSSLDPALPFHAYFASSAFSLPHTSTRAEPLKDQMLRVREAWGKEVWVRTGRVQIASKFLESLIGGRWAGIGEAEAWASGMYTSGGPPPTGGKWDEESLDMVGGSREEGRRVRGWLGEVHTYSPTTTISRYLVERYGFRSDTIVSPFTLDVLATYAGLCPARNDAVLCFGPTDVLVAEVGEAWRPATSDSSGLTLGLNLPPGSHAKVASEGVETWSIVPHPWQLPNEDKRYLVMMQGPNADVARALVRDMYTKSWSAFDRLVAIVPPGGSIGLDDKLFAFWSLPTITRFETGVVVQEFRDLRANPRCLVESQLIAMRVRWGRAVAAGLFAPAVATSTTSEITAHNRYPPGSLQLPPALPFDTISSHLPDRILCTGAAANFPSIANVLCDVFGKRVYVGMSQVDSAQISPHRNAPALGFPGRAAFGCALVARWAWSHHTNSIPKLDATLPVRGPFESLTHAVYSARWEKSGGTWARTNVSTGTGTNTPTRATSAQYSSGPGTPGLTTPGGAYSGYSRGSTPTLQAPSPSLGLTPGMFSLNSPPPGNNHAEGTENANSGTSALVPISALPIMYPSATLSSKDADLDLAQAGLARVADADHDAFLGYASVVGEWVRLEGVVRRG